VQTPRPFDHTQLSRVKNNLPQCGANKNVKPPAAKLIYIIHINYMHQKKYGKLYNVC